MHRVFEGSGHESYVSFQIIQNTLLNNSWSWTSKTPRYLIFQTQNHRASILEGSSTWMPLHRGWREIAERELTARFNPRVTLPSLFESFSLFVCFKQRTLHADFEVYMRFRRFPLIWISIINRFAISIYSPRYVCNGFYSLQPFFRWRNSSINYFQALKFRIVRS